MFALTSNKTEFADRRRCVRHQPGAIGWIGPGPCDDACAVARADLGFIGLDQFIKRSRIDVTLLGENGLEGAHAQINRRQFRMIVVVVMIMMIVVVMMSAHNARIIEIAGVMSSVAIARTDTLDILDDARPILRQNTQIGGG